VSSKVCKDCGVEKDLADFYKHSGMADGHLNKCKVCVRTRIQKHRREHPEQYARMEKARTNLPHRVEARRKYQEEHKEQISAYKKKWAEVNEASVSASKRKHYELHQDEIIARTKKWGQDNPDKVKQAQANNSRKRRAAKHASPGNFTAEEFKALCESYGNKCLACGDTEAALQADHIVPLTRGGSNDIDNIQPLCGTCNRKKFVSIVDYRSGWIAEGMDLVGAAGYRVSAPRFWLTAEASCPYFHCSRGAPSGVRRGRCGRPSGVRRRRRGLLSRR
jgi:5-methylcytosine-specific restriction endonuclease McrA